MQEQQVTQTMIFASDFCFHFCKQNLILVWTNIFSMFSICYFLDFIFIFEFKGLFKASIT